jgi:hypothetical protein
MRGNPSSFFPLVWYNHGIRRRIPHHQGVRAAVPQLPATIMQHNQINRGGPQAPQRLASVNTVRQLRAVTGDPTSRSNRAGERRVAPAPAG